MARKVSMQQIADYLGVSKFVVSRALSGKSGVSHSTKEKVFQAASQLGYFAQKNMSVNFDSPEKETSSEIEGQKETVLVLMPNIRHQTKESSYWGRIVDGISEELERNGFGLVIITENTVKSIATIMNPNVLLGVIGVGVVSTSLLLEVHQLNIPIVLVDHEEPLIPADTVFNNNFDGSAMLTNYLIGLGHKNLRFVGDIEYSRSFFDRWLGFRSVLESNGIVNSYPDPLTTLKFSGNADIKQHIKEWIQGKQVDQLPTAFVCANDSIALSTISALKELGMKVPEQISVTGFDNIKESYQTAPNLTTVNVAKEELGKRAVAMLIRRQKSKDSPTEKILLSGVIMHRETCAPVRTNDGVKHQK
ncbi:LacI family transcriptional regulator [Bacillus sp. SA1-12]|uniref:LacI family DNA-binding transcriptional regulator n=1 Tax=Bacillus sp. SA1-12 TaxID=1455638 RepID=UPI0006250448|nr:LacI family DNA-binding transcriptional regulator [Bacillus sp. SA1-12]KKI93227.1 LacI family transcriptional regulator [Bacillus sp. SA1-12]